MSKFDFLSGLESGPAPNSKRKYQVLQVTMGFESFSVEVPYETADVFIAEAQETKPKSQRSLEKIVKKYDGRIA